MSVTDAEKAFYESVLSDPEGKSVQDLRYAFYLAGADGGIPVVDPSELEDGNVPVWDADEGRWAPGSGGGDGTVTSVNGIEPDSSGEVVLGPEDVGAATAAQGAKADTAVQPDDPRLPIVMTQAEYDGITPVPGQVYIIQG